MNNSIVFGEILISQNFEVNGNIIKQIFSFNKRDKFARILKDPRFIIYDKFEERIRSLSLSIEGTLYFLKREDFEDRVELSYEMESGFNITELKPSNFKLVDYIPPNPGCPFCKQKTDVDNELFFFCEAKQKLLTKEIKTCKFFKQKRLFKS